MFIYNSDILILISSPLGIRKVTQELFISSGFMPGEITDAYASILLYIL